MVIDSTLIVFSDVTNPSPLRDGESLRVLLYAVACYMKLGGVVVLVLLPNYYQIRICEAISFNFIAITTLLLVLGLIKRANSSHELALQELPSFVCDYIIHDRSEEAFSPLLLSCLPFLIKPALAWMVGASVLNIWININFICSCCIF